MIPKIIHYCWFGGNPLPELAQKCIASWKKYCPDYEIKEWNEGNFDLNCCDYVREAYETKKWAFVSDYARLEIIYTQGGIYLDTDVELLQSLDEFLGLPCFLGTETTGLINTGVGFGAEKGNTAVKVLLGEYENLHFIKNNGMLDMIPCPQRNDAAIKKLGYRFSENDIWKISQVVVFPPQYFCPIDYQTERINIQECTVSIHHFSASWHTELEERIYKVRKKFTRKYGKNGDKLALIICIPLRIVNKIKTIQGYSVINKELQKDSKR